MSKKTIVVIILLILIGIGGYVFWIWKNQSDPAEPSNSNTPVTSSGTGSSTGASSTGNSSSPAPSNSRNTFRLPLGDGTQSMFVNDFRPSSQKLAGEANNYVLADTPDYRIEYAGADQSFAIMLLNTPLATTRAAAEKALLEKLGITPQGGCNLKATLMVPYWVSEKAAGINFGLSFCSWGATIPN